MIENSNNTEIILTGKITDSNVIFIITLKQKLILHPDKNYFFFDIYDL